MSWLLMFLMPGPALGLMHATTLQCPIGRRFDGANGWGMGEESRIRCSHVGTRAFTRPKPVTHQIYKEMYSRRPGFRGWGGWLGNVQCVCIATTAAVVPGVKSCSALGALLLRAAHTAVLCSSEPGLIPQVPCVAGGKYPNHKVRSPTDRCGTGDGRWTPGDRRHTHRTYVRLQPQANTGAVTAAGGSVRTPVVAVMPLILQRYCQCNSQALPLTVPSQQLPPPQQLPRHVTGSKICCHCGAQAGGGECKLRLQRLLCK